MAGVVSATLFQVLPLSGERHIPVSAAEIQVVLSESISAEPPPSHDGWPGIHFAPAFQSRQYGLLRDMARGTSEQCGDRGGPSRSSADG